MVLWFPLVPSVVGSAAPSSFNSMGDVDMMGIHRGKRLLVLLIRLTAVD